MALKIKPEHIQRLRAGMAPFLNKDTAELYTDAGMSERRYLFDAMWSACRQDDTLREMICNEVYVYANDDHLYSVFKLLWKEKQNAEQ